MKEMIYSGNGVTEILNEIDYGNGYKGLVINTRGQFPCGYVQFPEIDELESSDDIYVNADVHGGFTFLGTFEHLGLKGKWLGWDYAHCGDYCCYGIPELDNIGYRDEYSYTTEEVTMEVEEVLDALRKGRYEIERSKKMKAETMTIYTKDNGKWNACREVTDTTEIYRSLMSDLLHKKIHKCTYIRSITDTCNYDGTRTVTTYYDNNVKRVYVVKD